jgi:hypothetical protein
MKILCTLLAIVALSGVQASAKTLHFPNKGDTMFNITIPDDWAPEKDEDEIVEATSPDEHVYMSIWELESKEDVKSLGKDIVDMLKDHAKKVKLEGEPKEAHPGGMDGLLFSGTALDKEDDHAIEFFALLIGSKEKAAVVFIEADADTPKKEAAKLQGILASIAQPKGKAVLRAALALDKDTKPTTEFTSDAPQIYAFFIGEALKAGDKITGAWIAEDVGDAAPKNTKIDEASLTAAMPTDSSAFSLSKPTSGWPVGQYRMDILVNDKVVESLRFTIAKP